jgi:formate hydrogenlyase subunit 3/multisubunit Na+/H+ antiporter MnhD subunit
VSVVAQLPALLIMVPLAGAPLAFLLGRRVAPYAALVTAVVTAGLSVALAARVLAAGPVRYAVGGWGAPLGIDLVVDGVAAVFIVLAAVVGLVITVYASGYFPSGAGPDVRGATFFWPLWLFMWTALNGLFLSGDVFNVYVCLELVGMAAVALVTLAEGERALEAALRYLFASILAAMTYVMGVALLYAATGLLDMESLRAAATWDVAAKTGIGFMVAALVLKTALVPAHFWLPPAHSAAPTAVSAILSALVVKGSYFVLLRLVFDVVPLGTLGWLPQILGVLGAVAVVWGSVQALIQTRIKPLVAYSTVAQIGYLFFIFPLAASSLDVLRPAVAGTLVHAASHGLAKAAMFLAAGGLIVRFGHDRIAGMAGAARRTPVLAFTFTLAAVTMMGLPPSGGFAAKWLLVSAALKAGAWWWAAVIVAGGLLAAAYVFRAVQVLIAEGTPAVNPPVAPVRTEWIPLALAVASVVLVLAVPLIARLADAASVLVRAGVTP